MIKNFEEFVNESTFMATTGELRFTLLDLVNAELVTPNEEFTTQETKRIMDFFNKSAAREDAIDVISSVNKLKNEDIEFAFKLGGNGKQAFLSAEGLVTDTMKKIAQNAYCVIDENRGKIDKFVRNHVNTL